MAFERGTLDDQDEAGQARITALKRQARQLRGRKAQLEFELEQPPTTPQPADLDLITRKIEEIITDGDHLAKKALFEALIEEIAIDSDEALTPSFRIPIMRDGEGLALDGPAPEQTRTDVVRALPPRWSRGDSHP